MNYNIPINAELQQLASYMFTEPDAITSFGWLYNGVIYPVTPEKKGKGIYWYIRKTVNSDLYKLYVAPKGKLSGELLDNASAQIEAQIEAGDEDIVAGFSPAMPSPAQSHV